MQTSLFELEEEETHKLRLKVCITLAKSKEALTTQHLHLAICASVVIRIPCGDHACCMAFWQENRWKKVGQYVLHPTNPPSLASIVNFVDTLEIRGMACFQTLYLNYLHLIVLVKCRSYWIALLLYVGC
jgi:hypothetical protein